MSAGAGSSRDPSTLPLSRSTRRGSVASIRTRVPSGTRPTQATIWSSPSRMSAAASSASSADGSRPAMTSQVCRTCSPRRNRATPARSRTAPNRSSRQDPSSAAATSASRSRNAASAVTASRTCSSGDSASHRSQIGLSSSTPGAGGAAQTRLQDERVDLGTRPQVGEHLGDRPGVVRRPLHVVSGQPGDSCRQAVVRLPQRCEHLLDLRDCSDAGIRRGDVELCWAGVSCGGSDVAHGPRPCDGGTGTPVPATAATRPGGAVFPGVSR